MIRHRHVQAVVTTAALITVLYAGGAQVAATWSNHGRPAGTATNIGVSVVGLMLSVSLLGVVVVAPLMYLRQFFGDMAAAVPLGVMLTGAILAGDAWGVLWVAGLPGDLHARQHWYALLLPGATVFLTWWITVSICVGVLVAYLRGRRR
jgi:hypothetical protein